MFPTDRVVLKGLCFTLLERIDCTHICFETVTYSVPCVKKMWVNRRLLELLWQEVFSALMLSCVKWHRKKIVFLVMFQFHKNMVQEDITFTPLIKIIYSIPTMLGWQDFFSATFQRYLHTSAKDFLNKLAVPTS